LCKQTLFRLRGRIKARLAIIKQPSQKKSIWFPKFVPIIRSGILVMLLFWCMCLLKAQVVIPAIRCGNVAHAKKLIKQGGDVNQCDSNRVTALMRAVLKTDLSFSKFLIKKGTDSQRNGIIFTDSTPRYPSFATQALNLSIASHTFTTPP